MTGGLIAATLPWDGIDAPRHHRRHIAMDLPQLPRQRQDLREHETICYDCPLPLDWCRGGDRGERQLARYMRYWSRLFWFRVRFKIPFDRYLQEDAT